MKTIKIRKCVQCNNDFAPKVERNQKICSEPCRVAWTKTTQTKPKTYSQCIECSVSFENSDKRKKFCTRTCAGIFNSRLRSPESRQKQIQSLNLTIKEKYPDPLCPICEAPFKRSTKRKYCSKECRQISEKKHLRISKLKLQLPKPIYIRRRNGV